MAVREKCAVASESMKCKNCCSFCDKECENRCKNTADKCGCLQKKVVLTEEERKQKNREYAKAYNRALKERDPDAYRERARQYYLYRKEKKNGRKNNHL